MMTRRPTSLAIAAALLLGAGVLVPYALQAAQGTGSATVEITELLTIREIQSLHFGQIVAPSTGSNTYTLNYQNGNIQTAGDGDGWHVDGQNRGMWHVHGLAGRWVTATATIQDFGVPGVTVDATHLNGTTDTARARITGAGFIRLRLGGVITIDVDAPRGVHTTDVLVIANYD